ncbi:50S ribosomal protein L11 methyltransferase [Myxococcota bacterium]|nr:50S ribosomal protein L11 methyltransferase [Myxococcota bacterium]
MVWWQVRIDLPQALAEPVSWLIVEETGAPVEVQDHQTITRSDDQAKLLIGLSEPPAADFLGTIEDILSRFDLPADVVTVTRSEDDSWRESWKQFLRGGRVSDRVWVRPPWEAPDPAASVTVVIDPGMAFGTGQHQTTRGCIRMLDTVLAASPGAPVLDVGCGSGILSIVAALLGSDAIGVEIDLESFANARENVAVNAVEHRVRLVEGSADVIEGRFPVVVANILAVTLIEIADQIRARAAGELVLAGLMLPDVDRVVAAYPDYTLVDRLDDGEWAILRLRRQASSTP